jgi:hypothetical protein
MKHVAETERLLQNHVFVCDAGLTALLVADFNLHVYGAGLTALWIADDLIHICDDGLHCNLYDLEQVADFHVIKRGVQ